MPNPVLPQGVNPDSVILIDGVYYDRCVSCKENSGVRTDHLIELRLFHVDGSGQLCPKCFNRIYGQK